MAARILRHCNGLTLPDAHDIGAINRIILECLAMNIRRALGGLAELRGFRADSTHVCGGAVADRPFCQMIADASQVPVIAGQAEATAWGNICIQAIVQGRLADLGEARALIAACAPITRYEPDAEAAGLWSENYQRFLATSATTTFGLSSS